MSEYENYPAPGGWPEPVPIPEPEPVPVPVRRRRKPPKASYRELVIFAAVFMLLGGILGFWLRGFFLPAPEETGTKTTETTGEKENTNSVGDTTASRAEQPGSNTAGDWRLILVNKWNPLDEDYSMELTELPNGLEVDERCYDDLMAMLSAMEEEGLEPLVCSAFRSRELQQQLYSNKVDAYLSEGLSQSEAEEKAGTVVAVPGTSEHHLGLAVDIVDINNQVLDESQEDTDVQKWLMEHCWEYGFILRYPNGKTDVTGIIYEPWHYRYVGRETAQDIREKDVCFEEYLEQIG